MNATRTSLKWLWLAAFAAVALVAALGRVQPALAGDKLEQRGTITQMPPGGGAGTWVVGDMTFTADAGTEFDTTEGPLVLNGCAKVAYVVQGGTNLAQEIDSEPAGDCDGSSGGGDDDDGDSDGGNHDIEVFGVLQARPAAPAVQGTWTVSSAAGSRTFTADADTEFEQEHGALDPGICVEVEADTSTPAVAEKIESEPSYKCSGSDDDGDGRTEFHEDVYGTVTAVPDGGLGDWTIGGNSYRVTTETILEGRGAPIGVGTYVEVYFRQEGSLRTALKIEAKFPAGGGDDGNHGTDDGQVYGVIETFPAQLTGVWIVSSVRYTATQQTTFQQSDGSFAQGARVKVEYYRDAQGQLLAKEIETTGDDGGVTNPNHSKVAGYVTAKPAGGFIGGWEINGQPFEATTATKFKEDHGMLALDAFVVVEYLPVNNQRVMHEIETAVAPGAGDDDLFGKIENRGSTANAAAVSVAGVWRIGGVDYVVTPATDLNNTAAPLQVGNTALVNSYKAADGSNVATRIRGINVVSTVFLPFATR